MKVTAYFVSPIGKMTRFDMVRKQTNANSDYAQYYFRTAEIDSTTERGLWTVYIVARKGELKSVSEKIFFEVPQELTPVLLSTVQEPNLITANVISTEAVSRKFDIGLVEGEDYRLGTYTLRLNSLSDETAVIVLQKTMSDDYEYTCAPGCKEIDEGCLCPKIRILKKQIGYTIETGSGQVTAKQIKILPGAEKIVAVLENNGEQDIGASNLEEGIDFMAEGDKKVNIKTDKKLSATFITENDKSAKTKIILIGSDEGLIAETSAGDKEVKVLPSQISETAQDTITALESIELKEVGEQLVYEVSGEKSMKILGIIPVDSEVSATIDAQSGEVISIDQPWYSAISTK